MEKRFAHLLLGTAALAVLLAPPIRALDTQDVTQTVARVSYVAGSVSISRGDDPDNWNPADLNVPLTLGDHVYSGDGGRVELQVQGGDAMRLDRDTDFTFLDLTEVSKQISVRSGVASFHLSGLDADETFEVDTPNAAINFVRAGEFRVDVDPDGNTRVRVLDGRATVASGGGQVSLKSGDEMSIKGIDSPSYNIEDARSGDPFDRWVQVREDRVAHARSSEYVSAGIAGADDLDEYGHWTHMTAYGWVWTPNAVEVGWQPYRAGHWAWQDPWGWTWVAIEPWGWAPYHYGRWVSVESSWYWVPVAPAAVVSYHYAPAIVAFVGGTGWSASLRLGGGPGYVGWFPLAPADPFIPWWGRRAGVVDVASVTFVNRRYVTVVDQTTFVGSRLVVRDYVRDPVILREVMLAPVVYGRIPVVPTIASLRLSIRANVGLGVVVRPPIFLAGRAVVTRALPPPAPIRFLEKREVIERSGEPVGAIVVRGNVETRETYHAAVPFRPVASENGAVVLHGSGRGAVATPVQPVAPITHQDEPRVQAEREHVVKPPESKEHKSKSSDKKPKVKSKKPKDEKEKKDKEKD